MTLMVRRAITEQEGAEEKMSEKMSDGARFDIWSSIQASSKKDAAADVLPPPYVHPLIRRSSSCLSQKSLEICTESLGSETGSDGFSDIDEYFSSSSSSYSSSVSAFGEEEEEMVEQHQEEDDEEEVGEVGFRRLSAVNYRCSMGRRSPTRPFPPPLPSMTRRDGPCLQMRSHRSDGRLVLEAVPAPSRNYLHCQRQGGRLRLSFIETAPEEIYPAHINSPVAGEVPQEEEQQQQEQEQEQEQDEEEAVMEEEENVEEEVEVVDRGIVVEVKVSSRQPQPQSGGMKVHRSSLVINKFVGGTPLLPSCQNDEKVAAAADGRILPVLAKKDQVHESTWSVAHNPNMTGAAAELDDWGSGSRRRWIPKMSNNYQNKGLLQDKKILFTTKKVMNREALLHQVRRCSHHHRPLFIWEPCCIATS